MRTTQRPALAAFALAGVGLFVLAGCSTAMDSGDTDAASTATPAPSETGTMSTADYDDLVGPACADYDATVPDGAGSIVGMAQDPVAVAASNNPLLGTLVEAVSGQVNPDVDLVDTLNGSEFTVFAPVDSAFEAIDADTMATLATDAELLSSILTYHVVPGQILPSDIAGEHTTVQGEVLTVAGEGDALTVDAATVLCGGVHTANATVYLIDAVLMPPSLVAGE